MSDSRSSVTIRMPSDLKGKIEERAKREVRSLNAEMVYLLRFAIGEIDEWERWQGQINQLDMDLDFDPHAPHEVTNPRELDADEHSLLRMWRAMNEGERFAIRVVAERLAEKSSSDGTA
ncbi:Arc family DNA-binding protein [Acetobacter pasteurianus]